MDYQTFKIWFEGFSAGIENPTPEQLDLVKKKLSEVVDQKGSLPSRWTSTNTWESLHKKNKALLPD